MIGPLVGPPMLLAVALFGAAPAHAALDGAPLDDATLRRAFLRGDLVGIERARTLRAAAGQDVSVGPLALLHDLSRLVRCLPLSPVPSHEARPFYAARMALRLERLRLEQRLREGRPKDTPLDLLIAGGLYQWRAADQSAALVRWPGSDEVWPDEIPDPRLDRARCVASPDRLADGEDITALHRRRAQAGRDLVAALLPLLDALPGSTAAGLATSYLTAATASRTFIVPPRWDKLLTTSLLRGQAPARTAGLIAMARLQERRGDTVTATATYARLLKDDTRTDAEDSRARVRLSWLLEPDWPRVLKVARQARAPRPDDAAALGLAHARALYAQHDWVGLQTFGRIWLRSIGARERGPTIEATEDLLVRLALQLAPADAMAWTEEIGPPARARQRLDHLGQLAADSQHISLAVAVYDRLRTEAAAARTRRGPLAAADRARWTASRALLEYTRNDPAAFAALMDELVAQSNDEAARPLARTAPQRALARLCQTLLGPLTNDVAAEPKRRRFAGVLLEGLSAMASRKSRWSRVLAQHVAPLKFLAGPWAAGRAPPAAQPRAKHKRAIRSLGEVVVPRLPPRIEPADHPTPLPQLDSYVVYQAPGGTWVSGAPWTTLAP